jgi:Legionella pneumophila major outer membrane protein precursor
MHRLTKFVCLSCVLLATAILSHTAAAATLDELAARLDVLEKENSTLRARVNRLEAERAAKTERPSLPKAAYPVQALAAPSAGASALVREQPLAQSGKAIVDDAGAIPQRRPVDSEAAAWHPHFEISGSLAFLQPGAGNLEYATLVSPLPVPSPDWVNQSINPKFSPAFRVGLRYMPDSSNDIELNWTHQNADNSGSVVAGPTQFVGPPFDIGPAGAIWSNANGTVHTAYDAINLEGGHTFCADCAFKLRTFGGLEVAYIHQNLTGMFGGLGTFSDSTNSAFTGAGPRLGVMGQFDYDHLEFTGEIAGSALLGTMQSRVDFVTATPNSALVGFPVNTQSFASPNARQVVPGVDARLAVAYAFAPASAGQFKLELGYQAAVYFNAVNTYALTTVAAPPSVGVGVFFNTAQHLQSNFTDQGPYVTGSWLF